MKLFLIAGHSLLSPGVVANINEAEETIILRNNIAYYLNQQTQHLTDNDSLPLSEVINTINSCSTPQDIVIDIHFNAFNTHAHGTEVYIHPCAAQDTRQLAQELLKVITGTLHTKSRGIKRPSDSQYASLAILSQTRCSAIVIEICFADNDSDTEKYHRNKHILAKNIARTLARAFSQINH